jgi:hypothetical protein
MENLKLADETIGHIAKLIQMAILTGTDIMDNLRSMSLTTSEEGLVIHPDYAESFDANVERMLSEAVNMHEAAGINLETTE